MKIELFLLCDAAIDSGGKISILGIYDTITAPQAPAVHSRCAIVLKIRFDRIERGDHRLRLNIVDADGKPVVPTLDAPLNINFPDVLPSATAQLILDLQNLRFEKFGEYSLDLALDSRQEASIPIFVRQGGSPQQQPPLKA
jgi:hypothetical protein